jgi:hypothetical protein
MVPTINLHKHDTIALNYPFHCARTKIVGMVENTARCVSSEMITDNGMI